MKRMMNARIANGFLPGTRTIVILLFCLTVGIRLLAIAATFKGNDKVLFWEDVSIGRNLVRGNGYAIDNEWRTRMVYGNLVQDIEKKITDPQTGGFRPTSLKQPVFPFLIAGVFYVFGTGNFLALFIVHSVLAGLTAVTLFLALRSHSTLVGLAFALGFAIYPPFIYQCATSPESTIVLLFLLSVFLYQLVGLQQSPTARRFAFCGITAGALGMTNPGTLVFTTLALCVAAFVLCERYTDKLVCLMAAGAVVFLVISPWFVRNYILFDRIVMRAATGHELLKTRSEAGYPMPMSEETLIDLEKRGRTMNELQEGEMLAAAIKSAIGTAPLDSGRLVVMNLSHFWWEPPRYRDDYSLSYMLGRRIPYYILLILSVPVIVYRLVQARHRMSFIKDYWIDCVGILLIVADTAVYSYIGGWNIRYHYPVEFAMLLFAAQAALVVGDWLRRPLVASRRLA